MNIYGAPNKRKRVLRACDECRKKKVKCDGQSPCIHCKVYNYLCTYNQPANKKSKGFQTDLQNKILGYELFLTVLLPGVDLAKISCLTEDNIPDLHSMIQECLVESPSLHEEEKPHVNEINKLSENALQQTVSNIREGNPVDLKQVANRINAYETHLGQQTSTKTDKEVSVKHEKDLPIPYEQPIGTNALNIVSKPLDAIEKGKNEPDVATETNRDKSESQNDTTNGSQTVRISLPPLDDALHLIHVACDSAFLFKFYNRLNLIKIVRNFYSTAKSLESNDINHNKKLAFIYSFLAVGALLENDKNSYNYYNAAYTLLKKKLIETNDVMNIQTLFCMIIFLQCTAKLSTCYTFVGIALRSAFRVGLHRKVENINPIAQENRKRLFWSIYKIDVYMNTMLGLPQISDDQIDQDLPLDIEDEYITETGYAFPETDDGKTGGDDKGVEGSQNNTNNGESNKTNENEKRDSNKPRQSNKKLTAIAISNDHTKLIIILNHIVKHIYPINTDSYYESENKDESNFGNAKSPNFISQLISKVKLMEQELQDWLDNLPIELSPDNTNIPIKFYKPNRLLKLAYLHVQLALYRPFIHLISYKYILAPNINQDSIRYGMNCINVAIKIVELATEMHEHQLLNGGYWFSIYPIFYSVACLVYYIHENSTNDQTMNSNVWQITKYAEKGKDVLIDLKSNSMAAARTYQTLNIMFEQLNRRTKKFHTNHQKYFQDSTSIINPSASFASLNRGYNPNLNAKYMSVDNSNTSFGLGENPNEINFNDSQGNIPSNSNENNRNEFNDRSFNFPTAAAFFNNTGDSIITNPQPSFQLDLDYNVNNSFANPNVASNQMSISSTQQSVPPTKGTFNTNTPTTNFPPPTNVTGSSTTSPTNNFSGQRYYGSMIDKFDMNLFGRFLPPYMLESKSNNTNFTQQMSRDLGTPGEVDNNIIFFNNNDNNPKLDFLPNGPNGTMPNTPMGPIGTSRLSYGDELVNNDNNNPAGNGNNAHPNIGSAPMSTADNSISSGVFTDLPKLELVWDTQK